MEICQDLQPIMMLNSNQFLFIPMRWPWKIAQKIGYSKNNS